MKKPVVRLARNQPTPPKKMSKKLVVPSPRQIGGEDKRRGLKIMTILNSTIASREFSTRFANVNRDNVQVRFLGKLLGKDGELRYNYTSTESDKYSQLPVHRQTVAKLQPNMSWKGSRIAATCTCNDYIYRCEAVWAMKAAALEPMKSNGELPYKTNPGLRIFACKHLLVILSKLLKTGK